MPCLFALFAGMFPRLGTLFIWIARPNMFSAAFNGNWLWPILGIIFLPFTTLMYVILWTPGIGLTTWEWFWLIMAVVLDVMHWSSTAYANRERIPGYTPSQDRIKNYLVINIEPLPDVKPNEENLALRVAFSQSLNDKLQAHNYLE